MIVGDGTINIHVFSLPEIFSTQKFITYIIYYFRNQFDTADYVIVFIFVETAPLTICMEKCYLQSYVAILPEIR
jgi:hypothetical protein